MLRQVYKSTVKNLFRSGIFWLTVLVIISIHYYNGFRGYFGSSMFHPNTGTYIIVDDNDPRYIVNYQTYLKYISNSAMLTMGYTLPVATILSVVLILNRDHGDNFYEIEKASGLKPSTYILGRLSAILTVNFALAVILTFIQFYSFFLFRSPMTIMGTMYFITDSFVRLIRCVIFMLLPPIMLYVGLSYVLGCTFRSGIVASIGSIAYMIVCRLLQTIFVWSVPKVYRDYFSPVPYKLMDYLYYYDSYSFASYIRSSNTSFEKAAFCVIFPLFVFAFSIIISHIITKKRDK